MPDATDDDEFEPNDFKVQWAEETRRAPDGGFAHSIEVHGNRFTIRTYRSRRDGHPKATGEFWSASWSEVNSAGSHRSAEGHEAEGAAVLEALREILRLVREREARA